MASNAPAFCQIWFVWRGRHIWTREASAAADNATPVQYQDDVMTTKRIRFSSYANNTGPILDEGYLACEALTAVDLDQGVVSDYDRSNDYEAFGAHEANHFNSMSMSDWQDDTEAALNLTFWSDSSVHVDTLQLYSKVVTLLHLSFIYICISNSCLKLVLNIMWIVFQELLARNVKQVMMEADRSRKEAFVELMKRKETESKDVSAFAKVCAIYSSPFKLSRTPSIPNYSSLSFILNQTFLIFTKLVEKYINIYKFK